MSMKRALVTGATSGIGRATAKQFAERGYQVLAVGRDREKLDSLVTDCDGFSGDVVVFEADLTQQDQVDALVAEVSESYKTIDVLVNAAGVIANGSIENTALDDWDKMIDINLRSVFYLTSKLTPMIADGTGSIVNVSSVAGPRAFPNLIAYCVSKAAVDQLTRCAALDLAPRGIRVNAVNPGVVVTNLHKRGGMEDERYQAFLEHSKTTHPLGRVGEATEVADLIFFLASEKAGWITGGVYEIDGGRALTCAR
jgi:NAD(P)-dependent dehydrogenase (short-subunit alcohol dehydrogenase family)